MADSMNDIMHPGGAAAHPDFPNAPAGWTPESAASTASQEGVNAGEDLWNAVRALQEYFTRHDARDINARELHDALEERFHAQGGTKFLYTLLPGGPIAQGCRIAGLEPPAGSADASFGSVK